MAEFVEKCMEEMVPELKKMEKLKLFSRIELRKIVKNRKALEYRLRRKTKELNDFLKYIEYEINVLKLLKIRRKAAKCHKMVKEIDVSIIKRIHQLFQLACKRFPENIDLWLKHIEFCNSKNERTRIASLYSELLKLHPHKSSLWVLAAKHEMENNNSIVNARNFLQKAIRLNSEDKYLYLEYFRLELLCAEKIRLRMELLDIKEEEDESNYLNGEIAKVIFQNVKKTFSSDIDLFIEFLEIAKLFSFATAVQDDIYQELSTFKNKEKARAVCIMRSFNISSDQFQLNKGLNDTISAFNDTIKEFSGGLIYELFVENLLNISQTHQIYHLVKDTIASIYLKALEKDVVTEKMALIWIDLPDVLNIEITDKLIDKFPKNIKLISFFLRTKLKFFDINSACKYLSKYTKINHLNEEILFLWEICFDHYNSNLDNLKCIYEIGVSSNNRKVVQFVKQYYFFIFIKHKNISAIRKLYKKLTSCHPFTINMVFEYINVENIQECVDADLIRKSFETAIVWFGVENIDLWLKYIIFEKNSSFGKAENVGQIYERAKQYLKPELTGKFIEDFTLLN